MPISDKNFSGAKKPAMPNQSGAKSQPSKIEPADKYSPSYRQPDYKTNPQIIKPWQKLSELPAMGSGYLSILETMRRHKAKSPAGKGLAEKETSGGNAPKPFLKRGEIKKELRKEMLGIPLKEKEKIIPKKFGSFVTKTEIKKSERLVHRQYLKTGGAVKAKEERILKGLEKKVK